MSFITIAICSYNGGHFLDALIPALRAQPAPCPFDLLIIDNNSSDDTAAIAARLAAADGAALRYCFEPQQGIVHARNRALEECLGAAGDELDGRYMAFIDVDELPCEGWIAAAVDGLEQDGADCVGGVIRVRFLDGDRPGWLSDSLMGFLGELNNGPESRWVRDWSTPVWSGNVAYRLRLFSDGLRFDLRYNREGEGIGGGEDAAMLKTLLEREARVRYRPDMGIEHLIPQSKLLRRYFLRLHYLAGIQYGRYHLQQHATTMLGIAPFTVSQSARHIGRAAAMLLGRDPEWVRQAMNAAHSLGSLQGQWRRRGAAADPDSALDDR